MSTKINPSLLPVPAAIALAKAALAAEAFDVRLSTFESLTFDEGADVRWVEDRGCFAALVVGDDKHASVYFEASANDYGFELNILDVEGATLTDIVSEWNEGPANATPRIIVKLSPKVEEEDAFAVLFGKVAA